MAHRHATTTTTQNYHAFLLRLWRENATAPWRCSLQATDAVERLGFADLHQLVTYLLGLADEAGTQPSHLSDPSLTPNRPLDMARPARARHNATRDDTIVPQTDEE